MTLEERIAELEAKCAACEKRRKRRRKLGFTIDTNAESTSLANSLSVHEQDRELDEFDERRRR